MRTHTKNTVRPGSGSRGFEIGQVTTNASNFISGGLKASESYNQATTSFFFWRKHRLAKVDIEMDVHKMVAVGKQKRYNTDICKRTVPPLAGGPCP